MIPSFIGEHKAECGLTAAGLGLGAIAGREIYKKTPSLMTKTVYENGKQTTTITNRFIDYVVSSYKKDLYSNINPHTERSWLNKQISIMKETAYDAKANPAANKWRFQQIYDLGVDYLTGRKRINPEDMGLAKRGANAISYGRKLEKAQTIGACAIITGAMFLLGKLAYDKIKNIKNNNKTQKNTEIN